jgi:hypothetical protein
LVGKKNLQMPLTEFLRLGLGAGLQFMFGLSEAPREIGFFLRGFAEASLLPAQIGFLNHDDVIGTVDDYEAEYSGIARPTDDLYQETRDYWSLGISGGLGLFGGQLALHPVQFIDFIGGLFMFDPLEDDR